MLQARGDRAEGHALLSGVYNRFTEGQSTADLRDAASVIQELARGRREA